MISRAATVSRASRGGKIIPLGLSLSKRGIVLHPTPEGRERELSAD